MIVKGKRVLLFGGTTEGRQIAEYLENGEADAIVCVASDYGRKVLPQMNHLKVCVGRMEAGEIAEFIRDNNIELVIDATHPYAQAVTQNIKKAVSECNVRLIRIVREYSNRLDKALYFADTEAVVSYLCSHLGNVLVTTGSKELIKFTAVTDYADRIYARILPDTQYQDKCMGMGFDTEHIILGRGPFSLEENIKTLRETKASFMVTKDTGSQGGFDEKAAACEKLGVKLLVIERKAEEGMTVGEFINET